VPNITSLGACYKKIHLVNVNACLLARTRAYWHAL